MLYLLQFVSTELCETVPCPTTDDMFYGIKYDHQILLLVDG